MKFIAALTAIFLITNQPSFPEKNLQQSESNTPLSWLCKLTGTCSDELF